MGPKHVQLTGTERGQIETLRGQTERMPQVDALVRRDLSVDLRRSCSSRRPTIPPSCAQEAQTEAMWGFERSAWADRNRVMISEQAGLVDRRQRIGDSEGDRIIGAGSRSAMVTIVVLG